jgi:transposase
MEYHVGIDVSLELSSLCVLDATGKVIREAKVASEPGALVAFLRGLGVTIVRVGLEAGPLSQWLYDGLHKAGFEAVLLETRHVKVALPRLRRTGGAGFRPALCRIVERGRRSHPSEEGGQQNEIHLPRMRRQRLGKARHASHLRRVRRAHGGGGGVRRVPYRLRT